MTSKRANSEVSPSQSKKKTCTEEAKGRDSPVATRLKQTLIRRQSVSDVAPRVKYTDAFLAAIPKTDLHVHLDGSLRVSTLIELSKELGVELPSYDEAELRRTVFKKNFANLEEYLTCFAYTCQVMQTSAAMERVAYEFAYDNYSEGVRYFEVRFAPQLHCSLEADDNFGLDEVLAAVDRGCRRATTEFNKKLEKAEDSTDEPFYGFGIIVCAMRMFFPQMSRYYDALFKVHPDETPEKLTSMASVALVKAAVKARDAGMDTIVALDIAGAEENNEAEIHKEAYDLAHIHLLGKTVHAGEGFGPESIHQAVRDLHAERIGHGFHIFSHELVTSTKCPAQQKEFVENLVKYVSDRRITMEVCLTSNENTMPDLSLRDHAFKQMVLHKMSVTLSTDNRLVSNTTPLLELKKAIDNFDLTARELRDIVICGWKRSFYPGAYLERRALVRRVMNYYDKLAFEHGVQ